MSIRTQAKARSSSASARSSTSSSRATRCRKIYDALKMERHPSLTLEVQQQLGDGVVRTIALGSSDGLRRGMKVDNTGAPITVPVGPATLGRIMDVLGRPIDERGPVERRRRPRRSTATRRRSTSCRRRRSCSRPASR